MTKEYVFPINNFLSQLASLTDDDLDALIRALNGVKQERSNITTIIDKTDLSTLRAYTQLADATYKESDDLYDKRDTFAHELAKKYNLTYGALMNKFFDYLEENEE